MFPFSSFSKCSFALQCNLLTRVLHAGRQAGARAMAEYVTNLFSQSNVTMSVVLLQSCSRRSRNISMICGWMSKLFRRLIPICDIYERHCAVTPNRQINSLLLTLSAAFFDGTRVSPTTSRHLRPNKTVVRTSAFMSREWPGAVVLSAAGHR